MARRTLCYAILAALCAAAYASSCDTCTTTVTDLLGEWQAVQPKLLDELPSLLCRGCALPDVCGKVVSQGLEAVAEALNRTSPLEVCKDLGLCSNAIPGFRITAISMP